MSHDVWAGLSAVELAQDCLASPGNWFASSPPWQYQTYALHDPATVWPVADGTVEVHPLPSGSARVLAVEFKRVNEGVHGILTGIGQVQAYLKRGFAGSILLLPKRYDTLDAPGEYARDVLAQSAPDARIGVFTYRDPDMASPSPFRGCLACVYPLRLDPALLPTSRVGVAAAGRQRTQWAHVREGSTVPDYFYRYLQSVLDTMTNPTPFVPELLRPLRQAAATHGSSGTEHLYLSFTSAAGRNSFADEAWRRYWFRYVLTTAVQQIWTRGSRGRIADQSPTRLRQWDGTPSVFFARPGRSGRSKPQLVQSIASGTMSARQAWDTFAVAVRERAHSHREDLDSGLLAIGLIGPDGHLTDDGFRFVRACDRSGDPNAPGPVAILRSALLVNGGFSALLHYIHSLSEEQFSATPLAFTRGDPSDGSVEFESVPYRQWLYGKLTNDLRVASTSSQRGGRGRPPLEAELIILRKLGLVKDWRIGLGVEINWPAVQGALEHLD